jgi:hypothetical protein
LGEFFFQGQETDGARHFHYDWDGIAIPKEGLNVLSLAYT